MKKHVTISKIYNNEIRFISKQEIISKPYLEKEEIPDFTDTPGVKGTQMMLFLQKIPT